METSLQDRIFVSRLRSYRTYEEWKLGQLGIYISMNASSYRTYEEWKPIVCSYVGTVAVSSYRTYEEWKQENRQQDLTN